MIRPSPLTIVALTALVVFLIYATIGLINHIAHLAVGMPSTAAVGSAMIAGGLLVGLILVLVAVGGAER